MPRLMPVLGAIALGALLVGGCALPGADAGMPASSDAAAAPTPTGGCPSSSGTTVRDAAALTQALSGAAPGTVIRLADGVYLGSFTARSQGSAARPITICGGRGAALDGGGLGGPVLHLDHAQYWNVIGFSVRNGQQGVIVDGSSHVSILGLQVTQIGDEGIHLRMSSSNDVVDGNLVRETGLRDPKLGTGIYIGSAAESWCTYTACQPDRSDSNVVANNDIGATTARNIDVKEGSSGGVLRDNHLSGHGMTAADAWVDITGNGWTVDDNVGAEGVTDGFQVHVPRVGWGNNNAFRGNTGDLAGHGFAVNVDKRAKGTFVACSNKIAGTVGVSNLTCR